MEGTTAAALPDDAVREILVRMEDPAVLFRCAMACKRWRELVADPSFLGRCWPADSPRSSCILGFFAPQLWRRERVFVPAPRSPLGIGHRSLGSFFPEAAGFLDRAEPLGAHRGLLLLKLDHCIFASPIQLAVCDPLHGTYDVLPPLKCNKFVSNKECYAILSDGDLSLDGQQRPSPGYSIFFKVAIICKNRFVVTGDTDCTSTSEYDLYMFSSNEASWTARRECFTRRGMESMHNNAVVCGGTAYWLFRDTSGYYTLQVSVDTGRVSSTKLSIQVETFDFAPWLNIQVHGKISLLVLNRQGNQVEHWTRKDGEWLSTRMFELGIPQHNRDYGVRYIWMGERSGKLLLVDTSNIHIVDLRTGETEDVIANSSGLINKVSVPFEVDWRAFFLSRLGVGGINRSGAT